MPETSGKIYIDSGIVEKMELSSGFESEALLFLIGASILHETVHWGDWDYDHVQFEGDEEIGNVFETWVYGETIEEGNAEKKLLLWKKKK